MCYLNAFPGKAFEIDGADPNTFRVLNADFDCTANARRAFYRQAVIAEADPARVSTRRGRHQLL